MKKTAVVILALALSMLFTTVSIAPGTIIGAKAADSPSAYLTDFVQLTTNPERDYSPIWSPDASKIAYFAFDDSHWDRHIWVMNPDGTGKTQLTFGSVVDETGDYSPDGKEIVFARWNLRGIDGFDLMAINSDGTNIRQLTSTGLSHQRPRWSHDGQRLAFWYGGVGTSVSEIHLMNADGTNEITVLSSSDPWLNAYWSPDDSKILCNMPDGIWVVDTFPPYNKIHLLTTSVPVNDMVYSPDGTYILYSQSEVGHQDLYLIDSEGDFIAQLTNDASIQYQFDWSPDGRHILFSSTRSGDCDIWCASITLTHARVTIMSARLPSARTQSASIWDGNNAYIFGGGGAEPIDQVLKYNPASDSISVMSAVLPYPASDICAVWSGQYAYIFGGAIYNPPFTHMIARYDPLTDSMTLISNTPNTYSMCAVWAGNCAYLFGGYDGYSYYDQILKFDPTNNQLTTMNARMPIGIKWNSAVWTGNYAYIFGGNQDYNTPTNQILQYDPVADAITVITAQLPEKVYWTSAVWTGTYAYVFGGAVDQLATTTDKIFKFDPASNTCTIVPETLPSPRCGTSAIWDGHNAFIFGGNSGAVFFDEIIRFSPSTPDFDVAIWPTPKILLHVGGWNDSASLRLNSVNGFSGSIQLSYSGPSEAGVNIDFSQNHVYLTEGSQATVGMIVNSSSAAFSEYVFIIVAESGSIRHELSLTITLVGNSAVITSLVNLQEVATSDPPFSIQQNFLIAAPNGTAIYWAQNIIQVNRNLNPRVGGRIVMSIFQVFSKPDWKTYVVNEAIAGRFFPKQALFPVVFNLTSHIEGNTLVLENNASRAYNSARLNLPIDSYIMGYPGPLTPGPLNPGVSPLPHEAPEIVVVGTSWLKNAVFGDPTTGIVKNSIKLVGESASRQTQNRPILSDYDLQTGETSRNLKWLSDGAFNYSSGSQDQGLSFSANYS